MRVDGLVIRTTDQGEGPVFDRFFAGYDRAFVLPDEKEDREGFRACLALNRGDAHERLAAEYGPFRELCLVADDAAGRPVGGANLIAMPIETADVARVVTVNLNYIYVDPESRGRGHLRRLVNAVRACSADLFGMAGAPVLVFLEQNDPFLMSEDDYLRDTEFTGLDQFERLRIWARQGATAIDFAYEQPALSADHAPDPTLIMSVIGASGDALTPPLYEGHLRRFFGISVLKGRPIGGDASARRQLALLREMEAAGTALRLFDAGVLLASVADRDALIARLGRRPNSMREAFEALARH